MPKSWESAMSYVAGEFKGDSMGDARLDERLHRIV